MATSNETRAPTSRKYIAEQSIVIKKWSKTFSSFWSYSFVFALEKQTKNLNFHNFFTSRRPFGGYVQRNACTYFQRTWSWTRYSDSKLIKNISNFFVSLLSFCLRKSTKKYKFQSFWPQIVFRPFFSKGGMLQVFIF